MKMPGFLRKFLNIFSKNKKLDEGKSVDVEGNANIENSSVETTNSGITVQDLIDTLGENGGVVLSENGETVDVAAVLEADEEARKNLDGWTELSDIIGGEPSKKFKTHRYTDSLTELIELAKSGEQVPTDSDYEGILMGAVMEEKGASVEMIDLFDKDFADFSTGIHAIKPQEWKDYLTQDGQFTHFIRPAGEPYELTVEGIRKRINELREMIEISNDGREFSVSAGYLDENNSNNECRCNKEVRQNIKVGDEGKTTYTFDEITRLSDVEIDPQGNPVEQYPKVSIYNQKQLERQNGRDIRLLESEYGYERDDDSLYYVVEDVGNKVRVTVGRDDEPSSSNTQVYEQRKVGSFLDAKSGLGFYKDNMIARRLKNGDFKENPEALQDELKKLGLSVEETEVLK